MPVAEATSKPPTDTAQRRLRRVRRLSKACELAAKLVNNQKLAEDLREVSAILAVDKDVVVPRRELEWWREFAFRAVEANVDIDGFDPAEHVVVQSLDSVLSGGDDEAEDAE